MVATNYMLQLSSWHVNGVTEELNLKISFQLIFIWI